MENYLYSLYQMILQSLTFYLGVDQEKKKAGRPPKVSCSHSIASPLTALTYQGPLSVVHPFAFV